MCWHVPRQCCSERGDQRVTESSVGALKSMQRSQTHVLLNNWLYSRGSSCFIFWGDRSSWRQFSEQTSSRITVAQLNGMWVVTLYSKGLFWFLLDNVLASLFRSPDRVLTSSRLQVVPYTPSFWDLWTSSCHRGSRQVGQAFWIILAHGWSEACQCLGREDHLQRPRDESPKESSTRLVTAWNRATNFFQRANLINMHIWLYDLKLCKDNWI